ncbi:benzoate carboxyl methyltransferase-like [Hibiscus syriacus]|uniref:benzoate carboxyl methyltransferase-like n=1 Tax=Hibiscus syriacus TaxID=106335 RepID=UPI001920F0C8|nr:benzoate carboxyl methyltransferase-like [Hibiscus syriacus]
MNAADKRVSYANSSSLQKKVLLKTRPFLEDTMKEMLSKVLPATCCIKVADLGCASGPNTFFPTYEIMNTITRICQQAHWESPELQVFLNDLPHNDFNTVFRSVPAFDGRCFIAGVAGSVHERLFPSNSIHFIHSSYCLHWLSKVPKGVVENNNENVYISKLSPPNVSDAYSKQFGNDFSKFLRFRSEEMMGGGRMVLTLIGRSITDPTCKDNCCIWELLTKSLLDLVEKGLIHKSDVDSFYIPLYYPCEEEVREIVEKEGSFVLDKIKKFEVNWDFEDDDCNGNFIRKSGQNVADSIRAITEAMLVIHFGEAIIDNLFIRYAQHVSEHLLREKTKYVNIVLIMTMK